MLIRYHEVTEDPPSKKPSISNTDKKTLFEAKNIDSMTRKACYHLKTFEKLKFTLNNCEEDEESRLKQIKGALINMKVDNRIITDERIDQHIFNNKMIRQYKKDMSEAKHNSMISIKNCIFKMTSNPIVSKHLRNAISPYLNADCPRKYSFNSGFKSDRLKLRREQIAKEDRDFRLVGLLQPRYYRAQRLERLLLNQTTIQDSAAC